MIMDSLRTDTLMDSCMFSFFKSLFEHRALRPGALTFLLSIGYHVHSDLNDSIPASSPLSQPLLSSVGGFGLCVARVFI